MKSLGFMAISAMAVRFAPRFDENQALKAALKGPCRNLHLLSPDALNSRESTYVASSVGLGP
jgi:hypothetical protein